MKTRSLAAAFGVAALMTGFGAATASAAPAEEVAIQIKPTIPSLCHFNCGTWTATGPINDHGTYLRVPSEGRSPKPGEGFVLGPFKETFILTSSSGSFTIKAEEREIAGFVSQGVFQLEAGTGAYASATGHGDAFSGNGVPILFLDGVAKTG